MQSKLANSGTMDRLLNQTVNGLCALRLYNHEDGLSDYENLLRNTVNNLLTILKYREQLYTKLNIFVDRNSIGLNPLSLICYIDKREIHRRRTETSEYEHIFKLLQDHDLDETEDKYTLENLQELVLRLQQPSRGLTDRPQDTDTSRYITKLLSDLISYFINCKYEAETILAIYLTKCMDYERAMYSDIKNILDTDPTLANISQVMSEKVEQIISQDPELEAHDAMPDLMSQVDEKVTSFPIHRSPLKFCSNDDTFQNFYTLFLQISSLKTSNRANKDVSTKRYIGLMLQLYKRSRNIESMEINDFNHKESKIKIMYKFFFDVLEGAESTLHPSLRKINESVFSELTIFPEFDPGKIVEAQSGSSEKQHTVQRMETTCPSVPAELKNIISHAQQANHRNESRGNVSSISSGKIYDDLNHLIPLLNEFNLNFDYNFPGIFYYFVNFVRKNSELISIQDERYILDVTRNVEELIKFEDEEITHDELDIKDIVLKLHELHLYLCFKNLVELPTNSSLAMRVTNAIYFKNLNKKRDFFDIWNFKLLKVSQLYYNLSNQWPDMESRFLAERFLRRWYSKNNKFNKIYTLTDIHQNNLILQQCLGDWQSKFNLIKNAGIQADCKFMKGKFLVWLKSKRERTKLWDVSVEYRSKKVLRRVFEVLSSKFENQRRIMEKASQIHEEFSARAARSLQVNIFRIWYSHMNNKYTTSEFVSPSPKPFTISELAHAKYQVSTLSEKLRILAQKERFFILQKFMSIIKLASTLKQKQSDASNISQKILLSFVFSQWIQKKNLRLLSSGIVSKKDQGLKSSCLINWHERYTENLSARNFSRSKLVRRFFSRWKLKFNLVATINNKESDFMKLSSHSSKRMALLKWRLKHAVLKVDQTSKMSSQSILFYHWLHNYNSLQFMREKADNYREQRLKGQALQYWYSNFVRTKSLTQDADVEIKRRFFKKIVAKYSRYNLAWIQNTEGSKLASNNSKFSFSDRFVLMSYFIKWKQNYDIKIQAGVQTKVRLFEDTIAFPKLKSFFLYYWVERYNQRIRKLEELERRSVQFLRRSNIKRHIYNKWLQNTMKCAELEVTSIEFHEKLMTKKFLIIWYDKLLFVETYLNDLADDFSSQKDFNKAYEMLNIWSMKYIKKIKHNNQTCEIFKERWQNVKQRSILELWVYKYRENRNSRNISDMTVDADASIVTNQSPLANKIQARNMTLKANDVEANSSYLFTPLKLRVQSPFTPAVNKSRQSPSPTKLQETTLRIKNEKIDALRKHFGRAKATSTPKRENTRNGVNDPNNSQRKSIDMNNFRFVKLSPPKDRKYETIYPPNPPVFIPDNLFLKSEREDEKLSEDNDLLSNKNEKSVIETAKRLRKITPIYIPTEEEVNNVKFSPIIKLKQKVEKHSPVEKE